MDVFSTCGKDGSIRLFDMRCLNKYSVLHENSDQSPILRLSWNPVNSQTIAYLTENKSTVSLIDIRSPEQELLLKSHNSPVNAVDWSPTQENVLITAGEDKQVECVMELLMCSVWYGISTNCKKIVNVSWYILVYQCVVTPSFIYSPSNAVNNVKWSKQKPKWIALCCNSTLELCQV